MQARQHDLFVDTRPARTRARRADPVTSQHAAIRVSEFAGTHHAKILLAMVKIGLPAGAEQIAAYSQIDAYQVRKRLPELQDKGFVTPLDAMRSTTSGRLERLWTLK